MEFGSYTIILWMPVEISLKVGSLGRVDFQKGYYAYTGSARGMGGFKRIERHIKVCMIGGVKKWHIDYMIPYCRVVEVVRSNGVECEIAEMIGKYAIPIPKFGCSDCRCRSHLHFLDDLEKLREAVRNAHKVKKP